MVNKPMKKLIFLIITMTAFSCALETPNPQKGDNALRAISLDIPLMSLDGYGDFSYLGYTDSETSQIELGGVDIEFRLDDTTSATLGVFKTITLDNNLSDETLGGSDIGLRKYLTEDRTTFIGVGLGGAENYDYYNITASYAFIEAGTKFYFGYDENGSFDPYIRILSSDVDYGMYNFYDEYGNFVDTDNITESNVTTSIGFDISYNF